jgi:hypothetical protein
MKAYVTMTQGGNLKLIWLHLRNCKLQSRPTRTGMPQIPKNLGGASTFKATEWEHEANSKPWAQIY